MTGPWAVGRDLNPSCICSGSSVVWGSELRTGIGSGDICKPTLISTANCFNGGYFGSCAASGILLHCRKKIQECCLKVAGCLRGRLQKYCTGRLTERRTAKTPAPSYRRLWGFGRETASINVQTTAGRTVHESRGCIKITFIAAPLKGCLFFFLFFFLSVLNLCSVNRTEPATRLSSPNSAFIPL